ncbi:DUF2782 domain-containing protein [Piscinibacter sakaiensis]|uniref:DUF2782 domain-containing protein n=1 Tax=Piscinibacter sakaiensis TaxID=1547922 RepID=UPI003AADED9C
MRLTPFLLALLAGPVLAQTAATPAPPPPPADAAPAPADERLEPNVKRTVIEDDGSKIEELKIRGNTKRITVTPKVGPSKEYEIITEDGSRDVSDGLTGSRGAAGKRVWRVLSF